MNEGEPSELNNISYSELFMRLGYEAVIVQFMKKNGEIRLMLATRNVVGIRESYGFLGGLLAGHDKRCNKQNNNMAVIDLELGEARSFSLDRLIHVEFLGEINSKEQLESVFKQFNEIREHFNKSIKHSTELDNLDYLD